MDIGQAVKALRRGKRVARKGWNGKGMYLRLQPACDVHDFRNQDETRQDGKANWPAFVVIRTARGLIVPWNCSQEDLLADDWEVVE